MSWCFIGKYLIIGIMTTNKKSITLKATCPIHGEFEFVLYGNATATLPRERLGCYYCFAAELPAVIEKLFSLLPIAESEV
jgi:hypothetical protein